MRLRIGAGQSERRSNRHVSPSLRWKKCRTVQAHCPHLQKRMNTMEHSENHNRALHPWRVSFNNEPASLHPCDLGGFEDIRFDIVTVTHPADSLDHAAQDVITEIRIRGTWSPDQIAGAGSAYTELSLARPLGSGTPSALAIGPTRTLDRTLHCSPIRRMLQNWRIVISLSRLSPTVPVGD